VQVQARRNKFMPDFRAKVALEALKGDKSIAQLAPIYQVRPTQISQWKQQLLDSASSFFEGKHANAEAGAAISMDGAGRTIDNVFIERLWRTLKCDHSYLNPTDNGTTCLCRYQRVSQLLQLGPVAQFT
jgi:transposase